MMEDQMTNEPQFPEDELARLADGSLPEHRSAELRAQVTKSPQLQQALAEQERAVAFARSALPQAPDSLRRWVDEQTRAASPVRQRRRLRISFALPAMAAAAAAIAALILVVSAGSNAVTLQQTTHLALAAAVTPAPRVSSGDHAVLTDTGAGIPFPNWGPAGWKPSGARVDKLAGRTLVTVFYKNPEGERVGYAIVGGAPITVNGGTTQDIGGVQYTFLTIGSAHLVTWVQSGHTCVVAGRAVSNQTLLHLVTA